MNKELEAVFIRLGSVAKTKEKYIDWQEVKDDFIKLKKFLIDNEIL